MGSAKQPGLHERAHLRGHENISNQRRGKKEAIHLGHSGPRVPQTATERSKALLPQMEPQQTLSWNSPVNLPPSATQKLTLQNGLGSHLPALTLVTGAILTPEELRRHVTQKPGFWRASESGKQKGLGKSSHWLSLLPWDFVLLASAGPHTPNHGGSWESR